MSHGDGEKRQRHLQDDSTSRSSLMRHPLIGAWISSTSKPALSLVVRQLNHQSASQTSPGRSALTPHCPPSTQTSSTFICGFWSIQIKARAARLCRLLGTWWQPKIEQRWKERARKHGCDLRRRITQSINKLWVLSCLNASMSTFRPSHAFTLTLTLIFSLSLSALVTTRLKNQHQDLPGTQTDRHPSIHPSVSDCTSKGMRVSCSTLVMSILVSQYYVSEVKIWRQIYHRRGGTDEKEVMGEERENLKASAKTGWNLGGVWGPTVSITS